MNEVSPSELASSVDADAAAASVQRLHARRAFFMLVVVGEGGGGIQRSTEDETDESTTRRVVHFWQALGNSGIATLGCMLWGIMLCDNTVRKAEGYL